MSVEDDLKELKAGVQAIRDDLKSSSSTLRNAISLTADLVGIVSVVGIPTAIASLVQMFSGPDATQQALQRIENLLQVTFSFQQGEADLTQMQLVTTFVNDSRSRLQSLLEESLPYLPSALDELNNITLTKVNVLEQEPFWKRVFFDELLYQDFWFGRVLPPSDAITTLRPGRSFVFDYRLTLLGYLNAISVRLAAIVILFGSNFVTRDAILSEIRDRANALENYYLRILRGFTRSRTPTFFPDIQYLNLSLPDAPPFFVSPFDSGSPPIEGAHRQVGVVDAYEGDGLVDSFPVDQYPNPVVGPLGPDFSSPPRQYLEFAARYELSTRRREKQLYTEIGLDEAWISIQDLRNASRQPTEPFDPMLYWSLRDTIVALGVADAEIINVPPGSPPPDLSLWDTVRRLSIIGRVDTSGELLVSWRQGLEASVV